MPDHAFLPVVIPSEARNLLCSFRHPSVVPRNDIHCIFLLDKNQQPIPQGTHQQYPLPLQ